MKENFLFEFGFFPQTNGKYTFNSNKFSKTFLKHVRLVLWNNSDNLAIYNFKIGIYETDCKETVLRLIKYIMNLVRDLWTIYNENTAFKSIIRDIGISVTSFNDGRYINLIDGVYDITTYKLYPHSPKYYCTVQLPFKLNGNKDCYHFFKYLDDVTCGDNELKNVIQEMCGYSLCNNTKAEKAFFLIGCGSNGKSVLAKIIQSIVGKDNCSSTSLTELGKSFGLSQLINSNVNIAAENGVTNINSEIFKSIVSGDTVEVNRKYKDPVTVSLHTKLVMLFNELPMSNDLSYGFFRKIIIIPFNRSFRGKEIDVNLFDKLNQEMSGIFHWALKGLKRLRENNYQFSPCRACNQALEKYKKSLNPIETFFEDTFEIVEGTQIKKREIYYNYLEYCSNNSINPLSLQKFWQLLKAYFNDKQLNFRIKKIRGYDYIENIKIKKQL